MLLQSNFMEKKGEGSSNMTVLSQNVRQTTGSQCLYTKFELKLVFQEKLHVLDRGVGAIY